MVDRCNNCEYFKRLYTQENSNYVATIYGFAKKEKEFFQKNIIAEIIKRISL